MPSTDKKRSFRGLMTIIATASIVVLCVLGLGVLRFHSAQLAYKLNSLNAELKRYVNQEVLLKQELSALTAPVKIYSYCREQLGMEKVLTAEVLPMYNRDKNNTYVANIINNNKNNNTDSGRSWLKSFAWLFGR